LIGQTILQYKILEKLGEGGMGVVYKAEDTKLDRFVALKFLHSHLTISKTDKARFNQEAKVSSAINHPNVCVIYDIQEYEDPTTTDRKQFIIMEYVDGVTLSEIIKRKQLKPKEVIDYALQVAEALQEAHNNGIIHRDIKSDNIMVNSRNQIKVMDFGLAKLKGSIRLTKSSVTMGTPAYMAPEQARGEEVDYLSDIWSFGVVLYEMLTGHLPFKGDYEQAIIYAIVNEEPDLSKITELDRSFELESIVKKALEKEKDNRYNIKNLINDLSSFRENLHSKSSVESAQGVSIPSIAVLPFVDMSPERDQEYFCDGIAEEIITSLSHLEKLKVVARTSAFAFKGKQMDVREIGQKLSVDHILEGSIRKAGNRLRITAQLVQVCDGFYLWSDRFDRVLEDVFAIQDEISLAIADNLKVKLFAADRTIVTKCYTEDIDAYNDYLMGRYFVDKGRKSDFLKGVEYFTKSIEADPNFAQGYSGMANAYYLLGLLGSEMPSKVFPQAKEYAGQALQTNDTISEAHTILGLVKVHYDWDWEGAEKEFQLALSLNPNSSFTYYGFAIYYTAIGKLEDAITPAKKYLELDPQSIFAYNAMGTILLRAGHYEEAKKHFQKVMEMEPNLSTTYYLSGQVDMKQSFYDQGIAQIEKAFALENDNPMILSSLGWAYGIASRKKEAKQILVRLQGMSRDQYISRFLYAKIYGGLGDKDHAFKYLEEAYQQHAMSLALIITDESIENLHSDPRFMELLKKINLDKYFSL
jgi:serine/threonine protein kinase/Tfp pilus assembly protein PilF